MKPEDKNMLECEAKACGLFERSEWFETTDGPVFVFGNKPFDPLTNSADCAAMCAKLEISILWWNSEVECWTDTTIFRTAFKDHNDREAAWRYAATMVAAKIGGLNGD
jgi:hypothetical protein